jgi:hypothetical protein
MITLDLESWKLAEKKSNFSQWVRDSLRSERNKMADDPEMIAFKNEQRESLEGKLNISTSRLLYELEQRSEAEISALLSILQGSLNL